MPGDVAASLNYDNPDFQKTNRANGLVETRNVSKRYVFLNLMFASTRSGGRSLLYLVSDYQQAAAAKTARRNMIPLGVTTMTTSP